MTKKQKSQVGNPVWEGTTYNQKMLKSYLSLYPVNGIRFNAGILVLFFLNLFLIIPVLSAPYEALYAYILLPPLVVMNLWALAIMMFPRRLQLNYILFRGVFGIVCSVGFMIVIQKFAYSGLQLKTPWYAVGSFAVYGYALYQYVNSHIRKLKSPPKQVWKRSGMSMITLTTLTGLGYLAANLSLMFISEQTVIIVLMCVYIMLAFVVFHFIMELHRYYGLKRSAVKAMIDKENRPPNTYKGGQ